MISSVSSVFLTTKYSIRLLYLYDIRYVKADIRITAVISRISLILSTPHVPSVNSWFSIQVTVALLHSWLLRQVRAHPPTQPVYLTVWWATCLPDPPLCGLFSPRNWILPRAGRGGLEEPHKETVSSLSLKSDTFCGQNNSWAEVRVIRPFKFRLSLGTDWKGFILLSFVCETKSFNFVIYKAKNQCAIHLLFGRIDSFW